MTSAIESAMGSCDRQKSRLKREIDPGREVPQSKFERQERQILVKSNAG